MAVQVTVPRSLSPRQQRLLEELAQEEEVSTARAAENPGQEGFFKKLWHSWKAWGQKQ